MSKVQYHDPELPDMIDKEWRSAKCDEKARLVVVTDGGTPADGAATEDKQDDQIALLEAIDLSTQLAAGWFPSRFHKLLLADMTVGGIDLTAITPAGRKVIGILGSRTTVNGTSIYLEASANDTGVFVDLDFGRNYIQYGNWKKIGPLTSNGCFPLWVMFS